MENRGIATVYVNANDLSEEVPELLDEATYRGMLVEAISALRWFRNNPDVVNPQFSKSISTPFFPPYDH